MSIQYHFFCPDDLHQRLEMYKNLKRCTRTEAIIEALELLLGVEYGEDFFKFELKKRENELKFKRNELKKLREMYESTKKGKEKEEVSRQEALDQEAEKRKKQIKNCRKGLIENIEAGERKFNWAWKYRQELIKSRQDPDAYVKKMHPKNWQEFLKYVKTAEKRAKAREMQT